MVLRFSATSANTQLDGIETTIGTSPVMRILTGSAPASCAAAETGTILAELTLPSDWMAAASGGSKALSGTWQDASANASGTAGYFRIYESTATTCHMQGTTTASGGGGDMILDTLTFVSGQPFSITSFTLSVTV